MNVKNIEKKENNLVNLTVEIPATSSRPLSTEPI